MYLRVVFHGQAIDFGQFGDAFIDHCIIRIYRVDGKGKLILCFNITVSGGGPIAHIHGLAAIGEIEHGDGAGTAVLIIVFVHTLGINQDIGDDIAVLSLPLGHDDVIGGLVSAHGEHDVGVFGNQLVPHIIAVVDIGLIVDDMIGISGRRYRIIGIDRCSVLMHIGMGGDNDILIRICFNSFTGPFQHTVTGAVVKRDDHIVQLACGKIVNRIGIVHRAVGVNIDLVHHAGIV